MQRQVNVCWLIPYLYLADQILCCIVPWQRHFS